MPPRPIRLPIQQLRIPGSATGVIEQSAPAAVLLSVFISVFVALLSTAPNYEAAVKYNADHRGVTFLVMKDGKVLRSDYPNGGSPTRATELASGTKSFSGVMAACAVQDGLITWDETVANTITEWKSDARKSRITVRQLLSLSSGIPGGTFGQVPAYSDAIKVAANAEPGRRFQYGPTPYQCFGEFMRRKLLPKNESVMQYLNRRILDPLNIQVKLWRRDKDGNPTLPSGAYLSAPEWAKFGEMVRLNGKGVTTANLLNECLVSQGVNPAYGLTWWLPSKGPVGARPILARDAIPDGFTDEIVMAAGAGNQRLYVIRAQGMVIVRQAPVKSSDGRDTFSDKEFLSLILK